VGEEVHFCLRVGNVKGFQDRERPLWGERSYVLPLTQGPEALDLLVEPLVKGKRSGFKERHGLFFSVLFELSPKHLYAVVGHGHEGSDGEEEEEKEEFCLEASEH